MTDDRLLAQVAGIHGICLNYRDMQGINRVASPDTLRALLAANGVAAKNRAQLLDSLAAHRFGQTCRTAPNEIVLESRKPAVLGFGSAREWRLQHDTGGGIVAHGTATTAVELPPLASGVYVLEAVPSKTREEIRIITAPARAPAIGEMGTTGEEGECRRLWGMNLALYGLRSERNLGLGNYSDLAAMCQTGGQMGAGFIGINPVHATEMSHSVISPYSPSHRGFLNTAYIDIGAIPGLRTSPAAHRILSGLGSAAETLRSAPIIDYPLHQTIHQEGLASLYRAFQDEAEAAARNAFAAFRRERGNALVQFARFVAATRPDAAPCSVLHAQDSDQSRLVHEEYEIWLQWVADHQLKAARIGAHANGMALGLYLDLAAGARRDGAESWCNRDVIAHDVALGAPPDHVNPDGQNWNLAAYAPRKLASQNYRPLRNLLAAAMRHADVLRIDHILGLNRSFWIPDDGSPGGYVHQPFRSLLAILKIEAERARTVLVGEDLGLVPQGFRKMMNDNGLYGYSVAQYDRDRKGRLRCPQSVRGQVLSCFSTHDTPTVRGFERGRDIDWWGKLGWIDANRQRRAREQRRIDVDDFLSYCQTGDFSTSVHTLLARSGAAMVSVQLDDICEHVDAQNLPGTTDEHLNWRRKYAITTGDLRNDPRMRTMSTLMNRYRGACRAQGTGGPGDES
ncbi:MAG: 4-alpha-glucanotransferase [Rhodobacteraceae bacterium]|nr:4-alpha-glucanotransferase [Paracoccaceae bacterium]